MGDVIYKYILDPEQDKHSFWMPPGATTLHVGQQQGILCVWVQHVHPDQTNLRNKRTFWVIGTGQEFQSADLSHIGTVQTSQGYVWHIYQEVSDD